MRVRRSVLSIDVWCCCAVELHNDRTSGCKRQTTRVPHEFTKRRLARALLRSSADMFISLLRQCVFKSIAVCIVKLERDFVLVLYSSRRRITFFVTHSIQFIIVLTKINGVGFCVLDQCGKISV